jgi:hypothetical protein
MRSRKNLYGSPRLLNLFLRTLRNSVNFDLQGSLKVPIAKDLERLALRFERARRLQGFESDLLDVQLSEIAYVDHRMIASEDVRKPSLGEAPIQRHLTALEPAAYLAAGALELAFTSFTGGLTAPRAGATAESLDFAMRALCVLNFSKSKHKSFPSELKTPEQSPRDESLF